jgi:hypothetical protein
MDKNTNQRHRKVTGKTTRQQRSIFFGRLVWFLLSRIVVTKPSIKKRTRAGAVEKGSKDRPYGKLAAS